MSEHTTAYDPVPCPHCGGPMQVHRWQKLNNQGEELRIPVYRCPACHERHRSDPRRTHRTDARRQQPI